MLVQRALDFGVKKTHFQITLCYLLAEWTPVPQFVPLRNEKSNKIVGILGSAYILLFNFYNNLLPSMLIFSLFLKNKKMKLKHRVFK